jgi:hypothetical protein
MAYSAGDLLTQLPPRYVPGLEVVHPTPGSQPILLGLEADRRKSGIPACL